MKQERVEGVLDGIRGQASEIYSESLALRAVDSPKGPDFTGQYKAVLSFGNSSCVSQVNYDFASADSQGRIVSSYSRNSCMCTVCSCLAVVESLVPCARCGKLLHRECAVKRCDALFCPGKCAPGLIGLWIGGAVRFFLSPFVKFKE